MNGMNDFRLIGQREKIAFRCSQCGGCCRNVRDSVMLKPYDAYRLIRHIRQKSAGYTAEDILEQRCVLKPLSRGFEVYVLKTTDDSGVCTFLEDNRCSVYEGRPQTCRPLFRYARNTGRKGVCMFILEYLEFQGTERCPQHRWKQYIIGGDRSLLERIRAGQPRPEDWRVVEVPWTELPKKRSA